MKKTLLLVVLVNVLALNTIGAQTTRTFTGTGTWSTAARWTGSVVPASSDPVIIDGACTITTAINQRRATTTVNSTRTLTVGSGGDINTNNTANFTNSGTMTFATGSNVGTFSSLFTNNASLVFESGSNVVLGAFNNASTVTANSGSTWQNDGLATNTGTINNAGTFFSIGGFSSGTFTNTGTIGSAFIDYGGYDCMTFNNLTNSGTIAFDVDGTDPCNNMNKITVAGAIALGNITITTSLAVGATNYTVLEATGNITGSGFPRAITLGPMKFANLRIDNTTNPKTLKMKIESSAVLPIELIQFDVQNIEGGKNHLTWATASETNNKGFDIERSRDGATFQSIGTVKAIGKAGNYNFTDAEPVNGTNYYRLRQIDFDGTATFSKVVSVANKGGKGLKVYPTLVSNGILTVDTEGGQLRDFSVTNLLGQQALSGKTPPSGVGGLDVSSLAKGTYILKVGSEVAKFVKFVKQ